LREGEIPESVQDKGQQHAVSGVPGKRRASLKELRRPREVPGGALDFS
jgi:hypothetical protein